MRVLVTGLGGELGTRVALLLEDYAFFARDTDFFCRRLDALIALRGKGTCILYTSHYMEEVEALCDRVAIMDHGALIAEGTVAELRFAHAAASLEGVFLQLTGRTLRE